ncbi:MAG: SDR family oxidoreductase [Paracoccus sp. (in: a-proteobacteria)]|nr:SDR family oxidoreductase [Paracoccus sp. (in: a-proteobacteria)]
MKTYLIIGAGPGMGLATAAKFAKEGHRVVLSARNRDRLEELAEQLRRDGATVEIRTVDAADAKAVADLVRDAEREFGGIDVLHYNAGVIRADNVQDQPLDSFNSDLAINIGGALAAVQSASPSMRERGEGTILLTGGGFALAPSPDYLSISIGKAGIRALAQGLFEDFRQHGVHVATVTVAGFVNAGTKDAAAVADAFWALYRQPQADWSFETVYEPAGE